MERFTKITITLWVCLAILLQAWLLRPGWSNLFPLTLGAFVVGVVTSRVDRRAIAVVLPFAYLVPALLKLLHGMQYGLFDIIWIAAFAGVIVPDAFSSSWHIPNRWRAPLLLAVLVTVAGSVLIGWREIDGTIAVLADFGGAYWRGGEIPGFQLRWLVHVALTLVLGVLWFDWLCGHPELDFERVIVTPLIGGVTIMALVSAYQAWFDIKFLNETPFAGLNRASGTTYDANVTGAIAAFWIGGAFLWGSRLRGWYARLAPLVFGLCVLSVWASGSRTALMAGTIITCGVIVSVMLASWTRIGRWSVLAAFATVALLVGLIVAVGIANPKALNPGARVWDTLTSFRTPAAFLSEMWNRNGYGRAASILIGRYPYFGSGIGSFNLFVVDVSRELGVWTPPDNAQNWIRHQIVEFGFVGALGWIIWMVMFAWYVVVPRKGESTDAWTARAALLVFGFISMLGMPGQELMVVITFWTMAFWYARMVGVSTPGRALNLPTLAAVVAVVAVFAFGTASTSATTLRLSSRARAENRAFSYGFSEPLSAEGGFRRVIPHAAALVDATSPWLVVRARRDGTATGAVDVKVTSEGKTVLKARLENAAPIEGIVPTKERRILLEMTVQPVGLARFWPFSAATAVLVQWEFIDQPPAHFRGYDHST